MHNPKNYYQGRPSMPHDNMDTAADRLVDQGVYDYHDARIATGMDEPTEPIVAAIPENPARLEARAKAAEIDLRNNRQTGDWDRSAAAIAERQRAAAIGRPLVEQALADYKAKKS